jgi:hypothetical protein
MPGNVAMEAPMRAISGIWRRTRRPSVRCRLHVEIWTGRPVHGMMT